MLPTSQLRSMEVVANDIFNGYREMYYEGGAVSVYFWDLDDNAFAACVLFKKGARPLLHPSAAPLSAPAPASRARVRIARSVSVSRRQLACTPGRRRGDQD